MGDAEGGVEGSCDLTGSAPADGLRSGGSVGVGGPDQLTQRTRGTGQVLERRKGKLYG